MEKIIQQTIYVNNQKIDAVLTPSKELAWPMDKIFLVLQYMQTCNKVVLGGDILTSEMEYNYDSWYYNCDLSKEHFYNAGRSYNVAIEYIERYIQRNGNDFWVILVLK